MQDRDKVPVGRAWEITEEEIQEVLADGGYTADQRKGRLKQVLTELEN